jgi:hypothetical protein
MPAATAVATAATTNGLLCRANVRNRDFTAAAALLVRDIY